MERDRSNIPTTTTTPTQVEGEANLREEPSAEEIARRRSVFNRIVQRRETLPVLPIPVDELVRQSREETDEKYG